MFEIGIFCVILLAAGYWVALFIMGRREDVLHGQFVKAEAGSEPLPAPVSPVPRRPRTPPPAQPVASEPPAPVAVTAPARPSAPVMAPKPLGNPEALQSLLVSLKQELKNAAQI